MIAFCTEQTTVQLITRYLFKIKGKQVKKDQHKIKWYTVLFVEIDLIWILDIGYRTKDMQTNSKVSWTYGEINEVFKL